MTKDYDICDTASEIAGIVDNISTVANWVTPEADMIDHAGPEQVRAALFSICDHLNRVTADLFTIGKAAYLKANKGDTTA